jgi:hypothetical protein
MISVFSLFSLLILAAILFFWRDAMRAKEIAIAAANAWCDKKEVQLLDETVALKKISLARNDEGKINFLRQYQFEYSIENDFDRHAEKLLILGNKILSINEEKPTEKIILFAPKKNN